MKENYDNKSLVKVSDNIFFRIKNWFLKLFGYNKQNTENTINLNYHKKEITNKPDFLESIKISETSDTNVFNLQRRYESGSLKVDDMSKEEYSKIENLYNNQIEDLEKQIKYKKAKLATN